VSLSRAQLSLLLEGIDWRAPVRTAEQIMSPISQFRKRPFQDRAATAHGDLYQRNLLFYCNVNTPYRIDNKCWLVVLNHMIALLGHY
jgi:hypothetical protein